MTRVALLDTRDLVVDIAHKRVCDALNMQIRPGEVWALLGRNGTGKTTLLHTLAGIHTPTSGSINIQGRATSALSPRDIAQRVGLLLQDYEDIFSSTVRQTALMGRHPFVRPWQWESASDLALAENALQILDLHELADRDLKTLSGGECRRAHIATVLTQDPEIYLLDEPVNHLDVHHQINTLEWLRNNARERKRAVVMTMHDINLARRFCDCALLLFGNSVTIHGPVTEVLTESNLTEMLQHPMRRTPDGKMFFPG